MKEHLHLAKKYWQEHLNTEDLAIDATAGNGHDTLFLTTLCSVIGLDIQKKAIESTDARLKAHNKKADLYLLCHSKIDQLKLPQKPKLIVYNLGYLPGADKKKTTMTQTTLESLDKAIEILAPKGAISIMCYPGHEEGKIEERAIEKWTSTLSKFYDVTHHRWERDGAPSLFWITSGMQSEKR